MDIYQGQNDLEWRPWIGNRCVGCSQKRKMDMVDANRGNWWSMGRPMSLSGRPMTDSDDDNTDSLLNIRTGLVNDTDNMY